MEKDTITVKISSKMANLKFNGCDPDYIKNVCKASCCHSKSSKTGTVITINPHEQERIEKLGGVVENGLLQPKPNEKRCPFKNEEELCSLHAKNQKPFGCVASPFTLNKNNTLIVRNRYKLLKCYNDGKKIPAYKSFSQSLILLFGKEEAKKITEHFDNGGGDYFIEMDKIVRHMLIKNDEIKKDNKN